MRREIRQALGLSALILASTIELAIGLAHAQQPRLDEHQRAVVLITVEFEGGSRSFGTGVFVDHDGLLLTAEHVLRGRQYRKARPRPLIRHIEVQSPYLGDARFEVPVDNPDVMACGSDLPYSPLDLCLLRVPLTSEQRRRVMALNVSDRWAKEGESAWAVGPRCSDPSDAVCAMLVNQKLGIGSVGDCPGTAPEDSPTRCYVTSGSNLTPGYSGAPLIDDRGAILGVCSQGDTISAVTNVTYLAEFTPVQYLGLFGPQLPPSPYFRNPTDCDAWSAWGNLTRFDEKQLAPISKSPEQYCDCICLAMKRHPGALIPPSGDARNAFFQCAQSSCLVELAEAAARALNRGGERTDTDLRGFLVDLYAATRNDTVSIPSGLSDTFHKSYGDFFYAELLRGDSKSAHLPRQDLVALSLEAYSETLATQPAQPDAWRSMAGLLNSTGSVEQAWGALQVAKRYGLPGEAYRKDITFLENRLAWRTSERVPAGVAAELEVDPSTFEGRLLAASVTRTPADVPAASGGIHASWAGDPSLTNPFVDFIAKGSSFEPSTSNHWMTRWIQCSEPSLGRQVCRLVPYNAELDRVKPTSPAEGPDQEIFEIWGIENPDERFEIRIHENADNISFDKYEDLFVAWPEDPINQDRSEPDPP